MKLKTKTAALALFALLLGFFLVPGAITGQALAGEEGTVVAEVKSIAPGRPIWIALYVSPEEGAYVSWVDHESGDKGLHVDLELPKGFAKGELVRPAPQPVEGENGFGYDGAFWALQEILIDRRAGFSDVYEIAGSYIWHECTSGLDCTDIKKEFSLKLPYGQGLADPEAVLIFSQARAAAVPHLPWPVSYRADSMYIELELFMDEATADSISEVYILPIRGREKGNFRTQLELFRSEGGVQLQGEAAEEFLAGAKLDALLFITLKDGGKAVYHAAAANYFEQNTGFNLATPGVANLTLWAALGLAFLGGILLNLMPCVFPVLTLKIFGIVRAGAVSPRRLKIDSLAYTAGILLSFLIVALLLLTFRSWGQQVGWGFQLQSPYFVTALALILFLVAMSFAGLFEVRLPFAFKGRSGQEGALGSFYTGMLATLVATPCTAPFMAPALGFALTLPTLDAVLVFLSLGLGLAAPYLLIGFIPKVSGIFPKPGPWMEKLKKVLTIPVLLTVGWLLWVLFAQTGSAGVWIALLYMGLVLAFMLFLRASAVWQNRTRIMALALYGLSAIAILQMTLPKFVTVERAGVTTATAVAFSESQIWNLRLQGKGVFVNYTATWCITCLVNERLVFASEKFQRFLAENNIIYMVADWTNPDDEIAKSLETLGRTALPVYAFYPPGGPTRDPVLLPEILTLEKALEILSSELP